MKLASFSQIGFVIFMFPGLRYPFRVTRFQLPFSIEQMFFLCQEKFGAEEEGRSIQVTVISYQSEKRNKSDGSDMSDGLDKWGEKEELEERFRGWVG
jgi:hypothetical protein